MFVYCFIMAGNAKVSTNVESLSESMEDQILPKRSYDRYQGQYKNFSMWKRKAGISITTEQVILNYFQMLAEKRTPSSLWTIYSMLRRTIEVKEGVDIGECSKLKEFLKNSMEGFTPKKLKCFTNSKIQRFLREAPDSDHLIGKIVAIFAITGDCRVEELANLTTKDVIDTPQHILVKLTESKRGYFSRIFHIEGEMANIVRKYLEMRASVVNCESDRFFLRFMPEECLSQVIGKHKLGQIPKSIAEFLKLPEPGLYTCHSLRRFASQSDRENDCKGSEPEPLGFADEAVAEVHLMDYATDDTSCENIVEIWTGGHSNESHRKARKSVTSDQYGITQAETNGYLEDNSTDEELIQLQEKCLSEEHALKMDILELEKSKLLLEIELLNKKLSDE